LVTLSVVALVLFAGHSSGVMGNDAQSHMEFSAASDRALLQIGMLIAAVSGLALLAWLASTQSSGRRDPATLRLAMALNFSLLLIDGAYEGLVHSSSLAEKQNIAKGLLVIAALTWEITASGPVTNIATRYLPRVSRLLLFLAYALLVAVTIFIFFPLRYRSFYLNAFNPDEFILLGIPILGAPLIFAAFAARLAVIVRHQPVATPFHAVDDDTATQSPS
jgi:hypothetical protein